MKRLNSRLAIAGAFATLLLSGTILSTAASATSYIVLSDLEDDGTVVTFYQDDEDGHYWRIEISPDGKTFTVYDSDPNPDDTSTGKGSHSDKPDVIRMITTGEGIIKVRIVPADSAELLAHIKGALGGDGSLAAHYNPGDDDNGRGPGAAPTHSIKVKKTDAEIRSEIATANAIARQLAALGGAMGDGDEGSGEGPNDFNKDGSPGGTGGDDGNYTEGQNKNVGKTETDLLGAKPELVNPPHWGSDVGTHGDHTATGGSSTGGGSVGGSAHPGA